MTTSDALDELVNLRDLGGQLAGGGALTRPGVVYRSEAPHPGDRDPLGLTAWPPRVVVDLREAAESTGAHPMAGAAKVHQIRVVEGLRHDTDTDDGLHDLTRLYQGILFEAPDKVVEAFRAVLAADGPALVHCAAGKDRTGVVSALLLSAAGVGPEAIIADYLHTGKNMYRILQRLDELPPGVTEDMVSGLLATPVEAIERVLEIFEGHADAAAGWLRTHGVTDDELAAWHTKFLDR